MTISQMSPSPGTSLANERLSGSDCCRKTFPTIEESLRGAGTKATRQAMAQDSEKLLDVAQNLERELKRSADGWSAHIKSTFKRAAPSVQVPGCLQWAEPSPRPLPSQPVVDGEWAWKINLGSLKPLSFVRRLFLPHTLGKLAQLDYVRRRR